MNNTTPLVPLEYTNSSGWDAISYILMIGELIACLGVTVVLIANKQLKKLNGFIIIIATIITLINFIIACVRSVIPLVVICILNFVFIIVITVLKLCYENTIDYCFGIKLRQQQPTYGTV